MSREIVKQWAEIVAKNEQFSNYEIKIHGETNKGDGYLSTLSFVTISGRRNSKNEDLNIVIKLAKQSEIYQRNFDIDKIFNKEIHIYTCVKPSFEKLLEEKNIQFKTILPKCYLAKQIDNCKGLVLENLKSSGFDMWNRQVVMTPEHVQLILQNFAQWHACSIGLRRENPEKFLKITENNINMFSHIFTFQNMFQLLHDVLNEVLSTTKSQEILKKANFTSSEVKYIMTDLLLEDAEDQVILHGDCWTNNFMFKLDENCKPIEARIIDFQCSGLTSPVCDLSYFIFCCVSFEQMSNLESLLRNYHKYLSDNLRKMGYDPDKLFSFDKLMKHWKKYSRYGFILSSFILRFALCEEDEVPDFVEELTNGKSFLEICSFSLKNSERYMKRVGDNLITFAKYA